jgi:hypothetical protein
MGFLVEIETGRDRRRGVNMSGGLGSRLPEVAHLATVIEARALGGTYVNRALSASITAGSSATPAPITDGGS